MTEDIFDMGNVRIFKEIEKKKNEGRVYTLLCLWSAELSKAFGLRNLMLFHNICIDASMVKLFLSNCCPYNFTTSQLT